MRPVDLAQWDAESRRRLDAAIERANRHWKEIGAETAVRVSEAGVGTLVFTDRGHHRLIRLVWGGALLRLASLPQARAALMYRGRLRLQRADEVVDPTVSPEARSYLMIRSNGERRDVGDLCGFLVHELTHAQQEADSWLGPVSFGLAYLATLGKPYERQADAAEERAEAAARGAGKG